MWRVRHIVSSKVEHAPHVELNRGECATFPAKQWRVRHFWTLYLERARELVDVESFVIVNVLVELLEGCGGEVERVGTVLWVALPPRLVASARLVRLAADGVGELSLDSVRELEALALAKDGAGGAVLGAVLEQVLLACERLVIDGKRVLPRLAHRELRAMRPGHNRRLCVTLSSRDKFLNLILSSPPRLMEAQVHAEPAPEAADGANAEGEESDEQEDDEEESDEQEDDEAESDAQPDPDGSAPAVGADELASVVAAGDAEAMLMAGRGDARALFGAPAQPPPQRKVAPSTCPTLAPVDPGTVADDLLSSSSDEDSSSSSSSSDEGEAEPIGEDEDDEAHVGNGGGAESATSDHRAANGAPRKSTDESTDKSTDETPNEPPPPLDPLVRFSREEAAQVAGVVSYVVETLVVIKASPGLPPMDEGSTLCLPFDHQLKEGSAVTGAADDADAADDDAADDDDGKGGCDSGGAILLGKVVRAEIGKKQSTERSEKTVQNT